ncbi:hypothetical protein [Streptomyces vilmorinianum]|uniref:hypothetical protein n=1 Tax=Streptomyces vilmorinianum TaxID=3051092 RepID=UPI0010FAD922|nr:hypothetical protein [Streptomyces vilmorinianum]
MWGADREPVFVQQGRWVYNTRSPVARALMIATAVGVIGYFFHEYEDLRWSETELRDAVHQAARDLEAKPQKVNGFIAYDDLVKDAILATGEGPEYGLVDVKRRTDDGAGSGEASKPTEDSFEISTDDTSETYCMTISPPEPPSAVWEKVTVRLTVRVAQGTC